MRSAIAGLLIGAAWFCVPAQAGAPGSAPFISVIPKPNSVELRSGSFQIHAGTRISDGHDPRAARAARYFAELLRDTRGIQLATSGAAGTLPTIVFKLESRHIPVAGGRAHSASTNTSAETYAIDITSQRIVVSARNARGLLYGAVTLWQLCTSDEAVTGATTIPALHINDSPRFAWRGLLLDSARHYQSPEFILHFIDWMALHKLNVLQWHLTDDQAWRLEIKRYPRLTSVGAWRVPAGPAAAADIDSSTGRPRLYGGFYSQEAVRRIVAHAAERNVTIVPEIEMPGHATAAIVAYPRLASIVPAPAVIRANWGVYSNLYNADESTFEFLENVLSEVVNLFPGEYVHVGGDEAVKAQWKASPHIQDRMRELGVPDEDALQGYFARRMGAFLAAHHRRLIGWDEILDGGVAPDATVMSWRGIDGVLAAAAAGHDAVMSPAPALYFDNRQSATDAQPGHGAVITLEDVYKFDPMPSALAPEQRRHLLGLQASIWTEHIRTDQRVERMTFPRAAAVAEVGWSAAGTLDWNGFVARLPDQMRRYDALHVHDTFNDAAGAVSQDSLRLSSHQLRSCTKDVLLSLEDDAPLRGDRAVFLVDIVNPCWIYEGADLSRATGVVAAVGQLPFQFELGSGVRLPKLNTPRTQFGELEVRLDSCDGEVVASLPLQPAIGNNAVTTLPALSIPSRQGKHDLCLKFAQWTPDPLWVIDWFQLRE